MKKSPIDMIFDEDCNDNVFLKDENGQMIEFEQVAVIPLDEMIFVILHPVSEKEEVGYIFMYDIAGPNEVLEIVKDEDIIEAVWDCYDTLNAAS